MVRAILAPRTPCINLNFRPISARLGCHTAAQPEPFGPPMARPVLAAVAVAVVGLLGPTAANDGADDYAYRGIAQAASAMDCELYLSNSTTPCWQTPSYDGLADQGTLWPFPALDDYSETWSNLNPSDNYVDTDPTDTNGLCAGAFDAGMCCRPTAGCLPTKGFNWILSTCTGTTCGDWGQADVYKQWLAGELPLCSAAGDYSNGCVSDDDQNQVCKTSGVCVCVCVCVCVYVCVLNLPLRPAPCLASDSLHSEALQPAPHGPPSHPALCAHPHPSPFTLHPAFISPQDIGTIFGCADQTLVAATIEARDEGSQVKVNYVAAYDFVDGQWVKSDESSFNTEGKYAAQDLSDVTLSEADRWMPGPMPGGAVFWNNGYYAGGAKGVGGDGSTGMMFVLSTNRLKNMAFYIMNQAVSGPTITLKPHSDPNPNPSGLRRGPGGHYRPRRPTRANKHPTRSALAVPSLKSFNLSIARFLTPLVWYTALPPLLPPGVLLVHQTLDRGPAIAYEQGAQNTWACANSGEWDILESSWSQPGLDEDGSVRFEKGGPPTTSPRPRHSTIHPQATGHRPSTAPRFSPASPLFSLHLPAVRQPVQHDE